jgi:pSer/pThr/pTyr-binding forkhead associated (FHA) protein
LQTLLDRPYRVADLATKSNIKVARDLLERFFRDAEGRTNRQLDVYFTIQDLGLPRDKSDPALEFLTSRGLINTFGPDIAYLTDKGAQVIVEDLDINSLPKEIRDFGVKQPPPQAIQQAEPEAPKSKRPPRPQVTHIDPEGKEYVLPLGRVCTIGRSPGNDIQVSDQRASKRHAELRWENGRFVMVDLGSANGTLLNGEYTDQAVLEHDDELVIGRTMLIFQCPEGHLAEPAEASTHEEEADSTDDIGPEVARALRQSGKERQMPEPQIEEMPAPPMPPPSVPPIAMPPPSLTPVEPRSASNIRVVKGRPEPAPPPHQPPPLSKPSDNFLSQRAAPRIEPPSSLLQEEPLEDLFAEEPTPKPGNLFDDQRDRATDSAVPSEPSSDLFREEEERKPADLFRDTLKREESDDLFRDEPTPVRGTRNADLFVAPSVRGGDEVTVGNGEPMRAEELTPDIPIHESQSADLPPLEPIEILPPSDPLFEPAAPAPLRKLQPMHDERTVAEAPVPPDYELSDPSMPAFTDWDGVTNDDVMLANQPVISEVEVPEIPDMRAPRKKDEDAATLMVSRDDLFASETGAREDLAHWGDDRPLLGSHPEFATAGGHVDGEAMPVASHSIVNMRAPSGVGRESTSFHRTLAAIRERAERADLPDRDELLGAIDLLEHHAYVRVALAMIERES